MTDPREQMIRRMVAAGKSDEEIAAAVSQMGKLPRAAPVDQTGPRGDGGGFTPIRDVARSAAQGATFWLADEAVAGVRAMSPNVTYQDAMADEQRKLDRMRSGLGIGAVAGEMVGGFMTGRGAAQLASKVTGAGKAAMAGRGTLKAAAGQDLVTPAAGFANFAARNAARVGVGAATGGVYGAASAKPGERTAGAMTGTAFGAAAGAIPAVVEAGQEAVRFGQKLKSHWGPVNRAHNDLANALDDHDLARLRGAPEFEGQTVADVVGTSPVDFSAKLVGKSAAITSPRSKQFKREMAERAAGRGARVEESLTANSGLMAEQPEVTKRMVDEVTKPNVRSAYKAALKPKKALDSKELRAILNADDPAVAKAKSFATNKMRERRIPSAKTPFLTDGGDVAWSQTADYNAPFVDYTKRGLDSQIRAAIRTDRLDDAAAIIATRNRLVQEADKLIPGYAEARAVDEGRRAITNAMELGRRLGRGTVDVRDAEAMLQKIVPSSQDFADEPMIRQMFQRGVADGMRRRMGRAADGVKAINAILGNPNAKEVSRLAFPDEKAFQAFEKQLADEMKQISGEALARGAHVDPQFLSTDAFGNVSPWSVKQAATGDPMLMAAQSAGTVLGQIRKKMGENTAAEITSIARSRVGSKEAQKALEGIGKQRGLGLKQSMRAARQREGVSELSANLPRLFQQFLLSQNK